jgi:FAD/FMN-containing dehydrogenase
MPSSESTAVRPALDGEVLLPGEPGFDDARRTFNALIERHPRLVVRPTSASDVAAAVRHAVATGLPIAVRGGGHSVAGHGIGDDALVIDLGQLRSVVVEPQRRIAHVGGGALWLDVDTAAFEHGLATTGGTFGDTGVGGLALGGGIGWLSGTAGLTCDNLVGAELVTADGNVLEINADSDPELLWALRGGGGNFGVVTRFDLRLHPIGLMTGGDLVVALDDASTVLRRYRDRAEDVPDELSLFAVLTREEPFGMILSADVCFGGPEAEARAWIAPLLEGIQPLRDGLGPITYLEMQARGVMPWGLRHYWKGHFIRDLTDDAIDVIVQHARATDDLPGLQPVILIEPLHGELRRVDDGSAAFGQRAARYNVSGLAVWEDPTIDAANTAWAKGLADALIPYSLTGGGYVNYMGNEETPDRVKAAFGAERYARLARVKARLDPENRFRFNHNIVPDAGAVARAT